jgi:hypothetical protein
MLGAGFPDYDCGPGPLALTSRRFTGPQRSRCSRRFAPRYTAERIDGTEVHTVPLRELSVDNIVVVRPGTRVPADGTVVDGHASVGLVSSGFRAYATEATACVSTRRSAQSRPSETGILSVVKLLVTNQPSSFGQARRRHIKMN